MLHKNNTFILHRSGELGGIYVRELDDYKFENIIKTDYEDLYELFFKVCRRYNNGRLDDDTLQTIVITYENKIKNKIKFDSEKNSNGYIYRILCNSCYDFKVKSQNFSNSSLNKTDRLRLVELGKKIKLSEVSDDELDEYLYLKKKSPIDLLREDHKSYTSRNIENLYRKDLIKDLFTNLSEYDSNIIKMYYYEKFNDSEIGIELNKSRTTIRDRRKKILRDLKEHLLDLGIDEDILKEMD